MAYVRRLVLVSSIPGHKALVLRFRDNHDTNVYLLSHLRPVFHVYKNQSIDFHYKLMIDTLAWHFEKLFNALIETVIVICLTHNSPVFLFYTP